LDKNDLKLIKKQINLTKHQTCVKLCFKGAKAMIPEEWLNYTYPESPQKSPHKSSEYSPNPLNASSDIITVYIVLFVLRKMRTQLGLEATLEYAESYMKKMEKQNSKLRGLVYKALMRIDVAKMYEDAVKS